VHQPLSSARRLLLVDTLLAAAVVVLDEYAIQQPWDDGTRAGAVLLNAPLVALAAAPLALRRTRPARALVLMVAALALPGLVVAEDFLFWGGFLPLVLVIFTVARRDDGVLGRIAWAAPLVVLVAKAVHVPALLSVSEISFCLVVSLAAWGAGRSIRRLDRQERDLSAALDELRSQRAAREEAAVGEERTRIATEMHDVVAHAVSLMVLQVGAARLEVETRGGGAQSVDQLRAAEGAGRDALDQLRRSMVLLREHA
jgi:signal transduction histidine kinase